MTTAAQTATRNAPETNSLKTQVTVGRAIHVLSTEDEPLQVVTHRDRLCRNLDFHFIAWEMGSKAAFRGRSWRNADSQIERGYDRQRIFEITDFLFCGFFRLSGA
jgi:hypothetical protein